MKISYSGPAYNIYGETLEDFVYAKFDDIVAADTEAEQLRRDLKEARGLLREARPELVITEGLGYDEKWALIHKIDAFLLRE